MKSPSDLLISFAFRDADQLLDAACIPQGLGVLHVLGDHFVQGTADSGDRIIRHGLACRIVAVVSSWKPVDQISHGVLAFGEKK